MAVRGVDDVRLDLDVVVDEFRGICVVRVDSPNLRGCEVHVIRPLECEELIDLLFVAKVELSARARDHRIGRDATGQKIPDDGAANHAAVPADEDSWHVGYRPRWM